ncbi:hypothetical protein [Synechococcus sp. GFB01]|jgi:hypothetical protein|uniref:hypothetical protein n=1 Tax=Synechococcus sp. GFB01 TaxID=1662190 RepID=UPI00064E6138|nr:hypothetical protein [Synechococcus sp. GFB01]KMM17848.1 hypothetical protein SYNGFB01_01115 [Synechococcus sp. GFB01]
MGWWPLGHSIRGPAGPAGPPGAQGPAGPEAAWGAIDGDLADQVDLQQALTLKLDASRLTVGPTPPVSPIPGDLWIDTN